MSPEEALLEVRKDLVAAFGEHLAGLLIETAGNPASGGTFDAELFKALIASLCKDSRVQGMFGELGVKDKRSRWEKLVQ